MEDLRICGKLLADFRYRFAANLWVITAYYNPIGYQTRRKNYEIFSQIMRQSGIPLLTVECAFGDQKFDLPESNDVIHIRSDSMIWQKERLLNLAISWLPLSCKYVAWLDCDLIFTNLNWAQETIVLLENHPLLQVFETCNRLDQDNLQTETGDICQSFGKIIQDNRSALNTGHFIDHGHTGYGWAVRKNILDKHGLYECAIAGSADHYMAHAALGDLESECVKRMMLYNPRLISHFQEWGQLFYKSVQKKVGVVSGEVLHLWHGDMENRKYYLRHLELAEHGFNPYTDLIAVPGKPLQLKSDPTKPGLKKWFQSYFASRQEDGQLMAAVS